LSKILWKLLIVRMHLSRHEYAPRALRQKKRAPDQDFPPEEGLYIRFKEFDDGYVDVSEFPAANLSVNRSKYCKRPEWVLLARFPKYLDWGYAAFRVEDIPTPIEGPHPKYVRYDFMPSHEPELHNYSHSEIKAYKRQASDKALDKNQITKDVKLKFRMQLRRSIEPLKPPKGQIIP
jgi:hypothetical protein